MAHDITDCQCPGCVYRRYVDAGLTVEQLPKEYQNVPTLHAFELKYDSPEAYRNALDRRLSRN
jgi:hypothetical protein